MRAKFDGPWTDLLEISLKNLILRILTLGIYHPWARVNVRRFMWKHFTLGDDRFEFTGNGQELFIGFLKLVGGLMIFWSVGVAVQFLIPSLLPVWQVLVGMLYFVLIPFFIYSARRYLLSRTTWRGIRFGLSRVRTEYMQAFIIGGVVTILTLGLGWPWARFRNHKILTDATLYGGMPLRFDGDLREYYIIHLKALVLIPLTLGIYLPWFVAELANYNFKHTKFSEATLDMNIRGLDLLGIYLLTLIVSIITFGLGIPWATVYRAQYLADHFAVNGNIDFDKVHQMSLEKDAMADSVVDYFDLDLGW